MSRSFRFTIASVAASAALVGGAVAAPAAHADTSRDAAAARAALHEVAAQPNDAASVIDSIDEANAVLKKLGITPFTPTKGLCTDLSMPSAVGGAMPGSITPLLGDLNKSLRVKDKDINAIQKGEVLYGFVPVDKFSDTKDKSGMRVAWFNVNTLDGGFGEPMKGLGDSIVDAVDARLKEADVSALVRTLARKTLGSVVAAIPANGARGGIVKTGSGTVLSAIYGTMQKAGGSEDAPVTCYFFPSLGIATVK
ncbi:MULTISPECIES: hypothetical protein [Gordonia]|uniref:Uncharacterized protein n=1 Tax=Gordonia cholesterolivorans TaxID=559625 RepID=A0ABN3HBK6_9ACTN|nr:MULTISPECIES: hypothetical protein [Gordonia]KXT55983.1 hypothetical protein Y710_16040 [Gordonia sp. QH-12]WFN91679.1 hypothetical protein P5P27_12905 [Gordonia sihwensis]